MNAGAGMIRFCQSIAVPPCSLPPKTSVQEPARFAKRRSARAPARPDCRQARSPPPFFCATWNQIVISGVNWRMSAAAALDSGSESGARPDPFSLRRQLKGKLRFRSTLRRSSASGAALRSRRGSDCRRSRGPLGKADVGFPADERFGSRRIRLRTRNRRRERGAERLRPRLAPLESDVRAGRRPRSFPGRGARATGAPCDRRRL